MSSSDLTAQPPLIDKFGRQVTYLRLSVTDRCDLRCTYCMAERMTFLPRADLLTLEELDRVAGAFIARGVRKIRLTGGEPFVRRDIAKLYTALGRYHDHGLEELTMTTNATLLAQHAGGLVAAGVKRLNVSLDSRDPETFETITRRGDLDKVLGGIEAGLEAGLKIKLNTVVMKGRNTDELPDLIAWAHELGMDITLIEVMPLGDTDEDRFDQYVPLPMVRDQLEAKWTLQDEARTDQLGGPSAYVRVKETGGRIGFITPLTNNFCAGCNRVRVTCTGRIYMCLGQDDHIDLRAILRASPDDDAPLHAALDRALGAKPERHEFAINRRGQAPSLARHMSMTGG
ncbi:MAG: GTP 3',8-cyclase MoaA [Henriciella sp.]|nr:GTP 3',8-cyclase MoaA [Henriciella sp.]